MEPYCQLIEGVGAGEVVGGVVDVYTTVKKEEISLLSPENTTDCSEQTLHGNHIEYFKMLDLGYDKRKTRFSSILENKDLGYDADIAEEVAFLWI